MTHTFQLTGARARNFGLALIVLAIPATIFVNLVVRPLLPHIVLVNRIYLSVVNVAFLGAVLFVLAWLFRDRAVAVSHSGTGDPPVVA